MYSISGEDDGGEVHLKTPWPDKPYSLSTAGRSAGRVYDQVRQGARRGFTLRCVEDNLIQSWRIVTYLTRFLCILSPSFFAHCIVCLYCFRAISFFLSFFLCLFVSLSATLRENGWTDLHEIFREGVEWPWNDLIQFWANSGKWVGGSKVKLFVITGHSSESVAFARWQQRTGVNNSVA